MNFMNVKEVKQKFDRIDEQVSVDKPFTPDHCTDAESCYELAKKMYRIISGGDE